jgi:hypothetical protein
MSKSVPPVFMLSIPSNVTKGNTLASIRKFQDMGYKVYPFQGVIRKTDRSKIVMDGWKKFFSQLSYTGKLTRTGFLIAEDDVMWEEDWATTKKRMKMDKVNWLCYQKFFKEKQRDGTTKEIPVGTQLLYVPPKMVEQYKKDILESKSIHFDRFNSRLPYIHYAYKPHEVCAELQSVSATTGKVRKGRKIQTIDLPKFKQFKFYGDKIKKYFNIQLIPAEDLFNKSVAGKRFKVKQTK